MAKFEVVCENWNEQGVQQLEKVTSFKSEKEAINFASNENNVGRYGDMYVMKKTNGKHMLYDYRNNTWIET